MDTVQLLATAAVATAAATTRPTSNISTSKPFMAISSGGGSGGGGSGPKDRLRFIEQLKRSSTPSTPSTSSTAEEGEKKRETLGGGGELLALARSLQLSLNPNELVHGDEGADDMQEVAGGGGSGSGGDKPRTGGDVASVAILAALVEFNAPATHTYTQTLSHIKYGSGAPSDALPTGLGWKQWLDAKVDHLTAAQDRGDGGGGGGGGGGAGAVGGGSVRSEWERSLLSRLLPTDPNQLTIADLSSVGVSLWVTDPEVLSRCAFEVAQATFKRTKVTQCQTYLAKSSPTTNNLSKTETCITNPTRSQDPLGCVALLHLACGRRDLLSSLARASSNNKVTHTRAHTHKSIL